MHFFRGHVIYWFEGLHVRPSSCFTELPIGRCWACDHKPNSRVQLANVILAVVWHKKKKNFFSLSKLNYMCISGASVFTKKHNMGKIIHLTCLRGRVMKFLEDLTSLAQLALSTHCQTFFFRNAGLSRELQSYLLQPPVETERRLRGILPCGSIVRC